MPMACGQAAREAFVAVLLFLAELVERAFGMVGFLRIQGWLVNAGILVR